MARIRGLGKLYYNMVIHAKTTDENEINMLSRFKDCTYNLTQTLKIEENYNDQVKTTADMLGKLSEVVAEYNEKCIIREAERDDTVKQKIANTGKRDIKAELTSLNEEILHT